MKKSFCAILLLLLCMATIASGMSNIPDGNLPYRHVGTLKNNSASDENRSMYFDHNGLMLIGTNSGLKSFDGYEMRTFKSTVASPQFLPNNTILSITEDHNNCLWLGTRNGLVKIDMKTGQRRIYQNTPGVSRITSTLYTSHDGTVWIGNDHGLSRYVPETDSFINYRSDGLRLTLPDGRKTELGWYSVKAITEDKDGNLYIGTWNSGLMRFSPTDETFVSYPKFNDGNSAYSLFIDSKQRLWVGTWGYGLMCIDNPLELNNLNIHTYDRGHGSFDTFFAIIEDPITNTIWASTREGIVITDLDNALNEVRTYTTCSNGINQLRFCNNMITDGHGNIWIETLNDGIVHINTVASPFNTWNILSSEYTLPVNSVCSLFTPNGNDVWFSMKPYGIAHVDLHTGKAKFNRDIAGFNNMPNDFMSTSITSICMHSNGEIWMANNSYGIAVYSPGQPVQQLTTENTTFISDNYINTLMLSNEGAMWIGQITGLSIAYADRRGATIKLIADGNDISHCDVRGLFEDSQNNIWVATEDKGIVRISGNLIDITTPRCTHYCPENKNYPVDDATTCFEDSQHRLWAISNSGGLFLLDQDNDCFIPVNEKYNIPGDRIFTINEDSKGILWLTTDNALVRLDTQSEHPCTIYAEDDGLSNMLFFPNSSYCYNDTIFMACQTGFFYFNASQMQYGKDQHSQHNLIITDLIVDDKHFAQLDSVTRSNISNGISPNYIHNITIPSGTDRFAFVFALLNYSNLSQTTYSYYLDGYDTEWRQLEHQKNIATFENLHSGSYTLHLRATDAYGHVYQLPHNIQITICPPWYASKAALIFYAFLTALIGLLYINWYKRHLLTRSQLQMSIVLTNITHELLTPMAVISAIIDDLKSKSPKFVSDYSLIQNNISRLTRLLRQILEIKKSQAGQLRLLVSKGDLANFVSMTCQNISPIIHHNDCELKIYVPDTLEAWFDSDKVDKILYNLLSNAQKYNKEGGVVTVTLTTQQQYAVITIADEGIGIPPQKMKKLYSRFIDGDYRRTEQTGIGLGLSLTHELVTLHHGTIDCQSEVNVGTTFTVKIPINAEAYSYTETDHNDSISNIDAQLTSQLNHEPIPLPESTTDELYRILLVDDNDELLNIMTRLLSTRYHVLVAHNGQQAWNIIRREELDIVISDVMMPIMNGYELTQLVKNDPDYCQLPIVLLTAKVRDEDRNEGLGMGADEYLTKPFNLSDLQLRIDNIIANRERIRQRFIRTNADNSYTEEPHISNPDDIFLQKAIECIEKNISNCDYDRDAFASDMCVSASTLYNKLRSITGYNITGFITSIRLKKACAIAKANPQMSIAEISTQVGFSTPKYFSKCFKKEYGMLLREYINQN